MSSLEEKKINEMSDDDMNGFSNMLDKDIAELQIELALEFLETQGKIESFNEFSRLECNKNLCLWDLLDEFDKHFKIKTN